MISYWHHDVVRLTVCVCLLGCPSLLCMIVSRVGVEG